MRLIWRYILKHKKTLGLALALAVVNQSFSLLDPQIFRIIVDQFARRATDIPPEEFIRGVALWILASVGVAFVSRLAKNFQDYYVNVITQKVGTDMYADGVEHSFSLPYSVFEDQRSGELLQKLQKARLDAEKFITNSINILFLSLVGILIVLVYAFTVHWMIGAVYTLIIPVLGTITFFLSRNIKSAQRDVVKETAELAGSTTETIRNVELVKSLGLERQEVGRLNSVNDKILGLELKKVKLIRKMSFLQGTTVNALRSLLLFIMLWLIFQGSITLGEFFALLFYSFVIFNPLSELGNLSSSYQEASASSDDLEEVLKMPAVQEPEDAYKIETVDSLRFKNVTFSYSGKSAPAVKSLNLEIKSGETVAFVGPSGAGKSTIIKLIAGLYKPEKGKYFISGKSSGEIDFRFFRQKIGLVSQEAQLFAGTIRENLLFVNPDATDMDCLEALRSAQALTIIERGEAGLDTKIGEGGIKLSGGERQRLAIARALLRSPEIIIFDEATSSLDTLTEQEIVKTIKKIEKDRPELITILIAHRLSTVIHAKRIYVLERGKVIETGSHKDLLENQGLYSALWRKQSAEDPAVTG